MKKKYVYSALSHKIHTRQQLVSKQLSSGICQKSYITLTAYQNVSPLEFHRKYPEL